MKHQMMAETKVPDAQTLKQIIDDLAREISSDHFPTGERAVLKRMDPAGPPSLTFYRFAFRELPQGWERRTAEWMTILAGIALMCPKPHNPKRPVGLALVEAGYSEKRLERLLAAEGDTLRTLALRAARFLATKGEAVNWMDFARLLLTTDPNKREEARLHIARDFYRQLDANNRKD
jgi:CRISPR system Cascade subunit CasB